MLRKRFFALAATGAAVLALPLHAAAYSGATLTYSVNPTTANAWSTVTTVQTSDPSKIIKSTETVLAAGEVVCHHGDATCGATDGTKIGSASARAHFQPFCSQEVTQNFDVDWVALDSNYTPPSGWTIVSEVKITQILATFFGYVIENASGSYKIEVPSYPSLTCTSSSYNPPQVTLTIGTDGTTNYKIHQNPGSGSYTVTQNITYTDNTTESPTAGFTIP